MATVRQYFETDFSHTARIYLKVAAPDQATVDAALLCDFAGNLMFFACYVPGADRPLEFFTRLLESLEYGKTSLTFDRRIYLPSTHWFPGQLHVENKNPLVIRAQFFGEPDWIDSSHLKASTRIFIYAETQLSDEDVLKLKEHGRKIGHEVQFRSQKHADARSAVEKPLAFISYDSRDEDVAKKIAINLQRMMCPVWYDQFSLKVGHNLRDSIEAGIKSCKKCILILSQNFFSNKGWTKKEFDSVFTREILEEKHLVLPVWYDVTKHMVFEYSPSLLNVKGVDWAKLGEDEVCRQLHQVATEHLYSMSPEVVSKLGQSNPDESSPQ